MTTTNKLLNEYLNNERIKKWEFDDLKIVLEATPKSLSLRKTKQIISWFRYLHSIETVGWRTKENTRNTVNVLLKTSKHNPLQIYALFCPSYKKGLNVHGFRTDNVGNTTLWGLTVLKEINQNTNKYGFPTKDPLAIFFDLAIEQPEKSIEELQDLSLNIKNFQKKVPKEINSVVLSKYIPELKNLIGFKGVKIYPLPIPEYIFGRIVERGQKFYKLFGWSDDQILDRSQTIASSEALVGYFLRKTIVNSIMVYTPTMLERAFVYSGLDQGNPLPIIFPKHKGS